MKRDKPLRVLYAEDNADVSEMMTILLGLSEIQVTPAKTVAEARQPAQTEQFDVYLLDTRFPDGNGLELCRSLREKTSHKPIIFYSGNAYQTDVQKGLEVGAMRI